MKKAQMVGQVFVYILAVMTITVILFYGYRAISDFGEKGQQVEYIAFKEETTNTVKSILTNYGSIKRPDLIVPLRFTQVCFAKDGARCSDGGTDINDQYPLMCSALDAQTGDNVFVIGEQTGDFETFRVGKLSVVSTSQPMPNQIFCFENIGKNINIQMESLGDQVLISNYSQG